MLLRPFIRFRHFVGVDMNPREMMLQSGGMLIEDGQGGGSQLLAGIRRHLAVVRKIGKLWAYAIKRVAAGAHLTTLWPF